MKKKLISMLLVAAMVVTMAACGSSGNNTTTAPTESGSEAEGEAEAPAPAADAVKLDLSVPDAASSSIAIAANEFAKQLNEKSEGRLAVTVYDNGQLYGGDAQAAVTTMQSGGLDMLCLATSWYASFDSSFNMIQIPYLFESVDQEQAYINDEASQPMWDAVEGMGVKFLAAWTRSFRMTTNNKTPIHSPADFKGMNLRTPGNEIYQVFFGDGMGAVVTPLSFSEVYEALNTGKIDGQENPPDVPASSSFFEVQKYLSATNHIGEAWVVGMNPDKFNSLDADLQELILTTAQEMQDWKKDFDNTSDKESIDLMVEKGMEYNELTDEEVAEFVKVSESLYPKFQEIVGNQDLWDATMAFVGK